MAAAVILRPHSQPVNLMEHGPEWKFWIPLAPLLLTEFWTEDDGGSMAANLQICRNQEECGAKGKIWS
jgi:hypothetical protein